MDKSPFVRVQWSTGEVQHTFGTKKSEKRNTEEETQENSFLFPSYSSPKVA
jgi:hypothetical protein